MHKKNFIIILSFFFVGCTFSLSYQPKINIPISEAPEIIERILWNQPGKYKPLDVVVNYRCFKFSIVKSTSIFIPRIGIYHSSGPYTNICYFEDIEKIDLKKKFIYVVRIVLKKRLGKLNVYISDKEDAHLLIDALHSMKELYRDKKIRK